MSPPTNIKNPVTFGTHRAMFLPRPAARGRLQLVAKTNLASKIRWVSDALSNNVTVMEFSEPAGELTFTFQFQSPFRCKKCRGVSIRGAGGGSAGAVYA